MILSQTSTYTYGFVMALWPIIPDVFSDMLGVKFSDGDVACLVVYILENPSQCTPFLTWCLCSKNYTYVMIAMSNNFPAKELQKKQENSSASSSIAKMLLKFTCTSQSRQQLLSYVISEGHHTITIYHLLCFWANHFLDAVWNHHEEWMMAMLEIMSATVPVTCLLL